MAKKRAKTGGKGKKQQAEATGKDATVENLKNRISALEEELQATAEELEVQNEELKVQLDELHLKNSELEATSKALKESEEKYRELVENANSIIVRWDLGGRITFFNEHAQQFFGYSLDEIIGQDVNVLVPAADSTGRDLTSLVEDIKRNPERYVNNANENVRRNGERVWVTWTNRAIRDRQGKVIEILAVGNDITDLRNVEQALQEKQEELEVQAEELEAQNEELRTNYDELQRVNQSLEVSEGALRERELKLAEGQVLTNTGSWEMDLVTGEVVFSDNMLRILQLSAERYTYDEFVNRIHPEDRGRRNATLNEAINAGRKYEIEYRIVLPDNDVRYIHAVGEVKLYAGGKPVKFTSTIQDITERKRAENALKKSQFILAKSQEMAQVGNWAWNVQTGEMNGSGESYRILGIPPQEAGSTLDGFMAHVHPDDAGMLAGFTESIKREGKRDSTDFRITKPDGTVRYVNVIADKTVRDRSGRLIWVYGIIQDVTGRKRAEEAVRKQASLIDLSPDGIIVRQLDGTITFWSKGAEALYGWTAKEAVGLQTHSLFKTRFPEPLDDIVRHLQRTGRWSGELTHTTKDGRDVVVQSRWLAQFDDEGAVAEILESNVDITGLKQAEKSLQDKQEELALQAEELEAQNEELRTNYDELQRVNRSLEESEERERLRSAELETVLDAVPAAVWIARDPKAIRMDQNRLSAEWLRIPQDANASKSAPEGERPETFKVFKDGAEIPVNELPVQQAAAGKEIRDFEFTFVYPDGTERHVLGNATPLRDKRGSSRGSVAAFVDITGRKRAELALRESKAKLEAVFDSMNDGVCIMDANQNIVSANEAFARFHRFESKEAYVKTVGEYGDFIELYTLDGKLVPMEDWPILRGFRGETASNFEVLLKRTDTGAQWYGNYSYAPIRDTGGKIVGSVLTMRDITDRKRAESARQATMERFYSILSNMRAAVLLVTHDNRIEYANQAYCDYFDLKGSPADLVGLSATDMIAKIKDKYVDPNEAVARISEIVDRQRPVIGEEVAMQDGRTCLRDFVPLHINDVLSGRLWLHIDITERKRAEQTLRENEARLQVAEAVDVERRRLYDVLETLPAMICLLTPDYHVAFANRSFREQFGESRGKHCYEYCYGRGEPCEFCESFVPMKTGQPHHWEVTTPEGTVIDVHDFPFTDVDGSPLILEMDLDITERKRAEEALRASEERQDFSLKSADIGSWDLDLIDHTAWRSPRHDQIFGYEEPLPEWTYEMFLSHVLPEDRDFVDGRFQKAVAGHGDWDFECRIRRADGVVRWMWAHGRVMNDERGQPLRMFGINIDITERKKVEDALRVASAYNRNLIEASIDPLVTIAPDGKITDVNTATEAVTGLPRERLIATDFSDYFTEPGKAREGYRQAFEKGFVKDYPLEIRHRDGRVTSVLYNATVYRDEAGSVIGVFAAARDITERRRNEAELEKYRKHLEDLVQERTRRLEDVNARLEADIAERKRVEEALRTSGEMLRHIIDSSPVPMVLYAEEKNDYYYNKKFTETFGYTVKDVPTINEWWLLAYPDEEYRGLVMKRWYAAVDVAVKNKTSITPLEVEVTCKDGSKRYVLNEFSSIGEVNLSVLYDITERKRVEEELKEAKAQAELYLDLMGHDISNMHQIILGQLQLVQEVLVDEESPVEMKKELIDGSIATLERSAKLIDNVQMLQKLKYGDVSSEKMDLSKVLAEVVADYSRPSGRDITINYAPSGEHMVTAHYLLKDVFSNLLDNAVKHSADPVIIGVDVGKVDRNGHAYYRVAIEDNGRGIPDDRKEMVFQRFKRGQTKAKGTGLGLYIVKTLVESLDGSVEVEDRVPGDHMKGAKFIVYLPAGAN